MHKKILLGLLLLLIIATVYFLFMRPSQSQSQATSHPSVAENQGPVLVPAGTLPEDGKKFIISSVDTGEFLTDSGVMTTDHTQAKVFSYDSGKQTMETVVSPGGEGNAVNLVINFSGEDALVGSSFNVSNGTVAYGVVFDTGKWTFGSVNYNIRAALSGQYYNDYAAEFYYV